MKRRNLRGGDLARELCRQEKLDYGRASYLSEALLCRYARGYSAALKGASNETLEMITRQKQDIRRRYIEIITGARDYTEAEFQDFIWDVVRSRWFQEKADMILDSIEELIDGRVTVSPYVPRKKGEARQEGKQMKTILKLAYVGGENQIMSKAEICREMEISDATYDRRHSVAVVLFGVLMWIYANRREQEDINAGIVDKPLCSNEGFSAEPVLCPE